MTKRSQKKKQLLRKAASASKSAPSSADSNAGAIDPDSPDYAPHKENGEIGPSGDHNENESMQSVMDNVPVVSAYPDGYGESDGSDSDALGVMLIVGPEKYTSKLRVLFEEKIQSSIKIKTIPELKVEDSQRWKNENLYNILFVIDNKDPQSLKSIDNILTVLSQNYHMPMACVDFILAKDGKGPGRSPISAVDIFTFLQKFGRPIITVVFQKGWEHNLKDHLDIFLRRFQSHSCQSHSSSSSEEELRYKLKA